MAADCRLGDYHLTESSFIATLWVRAMVLNFPSAATLYTGAHIVNTQPYIFSVLLHNLLL